MSRPDGPSPWEDAALAAALLAIDPTGAVGAAVRARAGPVRDRWLALLRELLPPATPWRRLPLHAGDGRLLGGLDLAATLRAGRPVAERGLLAEADGGVVLLASAERLPAATAARLAAVLDSGEVRTERDGLALRLPARVAVVALDEGAAEDERPPAALLERLAFHLDLDGIGHREATAAVYGPESVIAARGRLAGVRADDAILAALCEAAAALGIGSVRAPLSALRMARAAAALAGREEVATEDAAAAARLVLAPRATVLPPGEPEVPRKPEGQGGEEREHSPDTDGAGERPPGEVVLAAARAALPPGLLARLRLAGGDLRRAGQAAGKGGGLRRAPTRGRPAGVRQGEPRSGTRLSVVDTLRAAAPWQPLRRREGGTARVEVRREDFRVTRLKQRSRTTTIFVVDASGSAAFHRLAEAKGAVELLLAESYVRRDRVALLAFRGQGAELLLPPTRSLVRAKRSLAELPGGGGTPLAAGIDAALALADAVRRKGETPAIVLLTDGRGNVARDGATGRARAGEEALAAARSLRAAGLRAILVDTSPRPQPTAQRLAEEMAALYLPLPYADAAALSRAVGAVQRA